jgi:adenine-specific DNA-methyltransferase
MAHIDNLIAVIKDPQLREALRTEYDKVTKTRQFGLVFDRHQPESVVLPGFTIRAGEKVQVFLEDTQDRTAIDGSGVWTISSISRDGGHAQLRDTDGNTRAAQLERLVATREFGDPIYPGLISTSRVVRGGGTDGDDGGKPFHTVINAENYHALEALLFANEGQVDAIYIDPPYNTGARDWKYNNDYVDDADPYRHSKWLSFIERRLLLAKRLLNPVDSVLIVSIDEKEYLRLGLLLEQVFPAARVTMISSVINSKGSARNDTFRRTDEYLFFVMIGAAAPQGLELSDEWRVVSDARAQALRWATLARQGANGRRTARPNLFYPIYVRNGNDGPVFDSVGEAFKSTRWAELRAPEGAEAVWPIRGSGEEGTWSVAPQSLRELISKGFARLGGWRGSQTTVTFLTSGERAKVESGILPVTGRRPDGSVTVDDGRYRPRFVPGTQWRIASHNSGGSGGVGMIRSLLSDRTFPYPKSLYAVDDALRFFVAGKPNALVVDFFAGSGTTTHAVMRLNHQYGGRRRSICVTNNEVGVAEQAALRVRGLYPGDPEWEAGGICDYITRPRIQAAITGTTSRGEPITGDYRFIDEFPMAEGFTENAEFFTLTYEDPALVSLGRRFEAISPLLWLRAGAVGERIDHVAEEGWAIPPQAVYGVLFDTTAWPRFIAAVAARDGSVIPLTHLFVVTDSLVEFQQIVSRLDQSLKITRLYADYLRSFEINTPR